MPTEGEPGSPHEAFRRSGKWWVVIPYPGFVSTSCLTADNCSFPATLLPPAGRSCAQETPECVVPAGGPAPVSSANRVVWWGPIARGAGRWGAPPCGGTRKCASCAPLCFVPLRQKGGHPKTTRSSIPANHPQPTAAALGESPLAKHAPHFFSLAVSYNPASHSAHCAAKKQKKPWPRANIISTAPFKHTAVHAIYKKGHGQ